MQKTVIAVGEILWDVFPSGRKAGGSSMNVALNLHKQGIDSRLISAVGKDEEGRDLLEFLQKQDYGTELIQVQDKFSTSKVVVELDDHQQATYTIVEPVAWDAIEYSEEARAAVESADAFVYCSLTCRNEKSRTTVYSLLQVAKLKVFDINLRQPFYNPETLRSLMEYADILKVNEDELSYLKDAFQLSGTSEEQLLKQLSHHFQIKIICLTLGEKGASVLEDNRLYKHKGYTVQVADTVGAGDSFLATFVASYLEGYPLDTVLDRACKVGAFVASQHGANPEYSMEVFN